MIRYYWDACTFISRLQGDTDRIIPLEYLTDEAAAGRIEIVTSTLTIAEVCHLKKECSEEEMTEDIATISQFFSNDYISLVQVTKRIATDAANISRQYGVKPPDAIHLATAISANCPIVHTYDGKKLLKLDNMIGDPALRIMIPRPEVQADLFGGEELSDAPEEPEPAPQSQLNWPPRCTDGKPFDCRGWITPTRRVWGRKSTMFAP
jgi:predicted nucleic acid-binding protein